MLGSIDCLLTCLVSDSLTRAEHEPNKELFGSGGGEHRCRSLRCAARFRRHHRRGGNTQARGRIGLSAALAIENAVEEVMKVGSRRLYDLLPEDHTDFTRHQALVHAVGNLSWSGKGRSDGGLARLASRQTSGHSPSRSTQSQPAAST